MKMSPHLSTITTRQRTILLTAAVFGLLGVLLGTFGAHGVQQKVSAYDYKNYEKGVQYHYVFTLMLFAVGIMSVLFWHVRGWFGVFVFFALGIVFFSGSLYFIATQSIHQAVLPGFIYLVTPMGGLCFMIGWVWLIVTLAKLKTNPA